MRWFYFFSTPPHSLYFETTPPLSYLLTRKVSTVFQLFQVLKLVSPHEKLHFLSALKPFPLLLLAQDWLAPFTPSSLSLTFSSSRIKDKAKEWWVRENVPYFPGDNFNRFLLILAWCFSAWCWPAINDGLCVAGVHMLLMLLGPLWAMVGPSAASQSLNTLSNLNALPDLSPYLLLPTWVFMQRAALLNGLQARYFSSASAVFYNVHLT